MKPGVYFLVFACLLCGCLGEGCVSGSATPASETRQVGSFHSVDVQGLGNVYVTQADEPSLMVSADDNILSLIATEVVDGVLVVKTEGCVDPAEPVNVRVAMKEVKTVSVTGAGNIVSESRVEGDLMRLSIQGAGTIDFYPAVRRLSTVLSGSAKAKYMGHADTHILQMSGQSDVDAYDLDTQTTIVTSSDQAKARVYASDELDAKVTGSGIIHYRGNPENVYQTSTGTGKVVGKKDN